jgi:hypothetical protein
MYLFCLQHDHWHKINRPVFRRGSTNFRSLEKYDYGPRATVKIEEEVTEKAKAQNDGRKNKKAAEVPAKERAENRAGGARRKLDRARRGIDRDIEVTNEMLTRAVEKMGDLANINKFLTAHNPRQAIATANSQFATIVLHVPGEGQKALTRAQERSWAAAGQRTLNDTLPNAKPSLKVDGLLGEKSIAHLKMFAGLDTRTREGRLGNAKEAEENEELLKYAEYRTAYLNTIADHDLFAFVDPTDRGFLKSFNKAAAAMKEDSVGYNFNPDVDIYDAEAWNRLFAATLTEGERAQVLPNEKMAEEWRKKENKKAAQEAKVFINTVRTKINDMLKITAEMVEDANKEREYDHISIPLEGVNLEEEERIIRQHYKRTLWANFNNLQKGEEVDDGWKVSDYLGNGEYANQAVRDAYGEYQQLLAHFNNPTLSTAQAAEATTDLNNGLSQLETAIQAQQAGALKRIKEWQKPGRLPTFVNNHRTRRNRAPTFNAQSALDQMAQQLPRTYGGPRTLAEIYAALKDSNRKTPFKTYGELKRGCRQGTLKAIASKLKLVARTPETREANLAMLLEVFKNAILYRNLEQFIAEKRGNFLTV